MTVLLTLGIMFLAAAVAIVVLMILDEPRPYEREKLSDFPEENDVVQ